MREMPELARALVHFRLELRMIGANLRLGALELLRHLIECLRQPIELARAAARYARAYVAARDLSSRGGQPLHGTRHARHRGERDTDQHEQRRRARPEKMLVRLLVGL